ncbi:GDSL-type esterase/lipase family protein [Seonamhaeicola sp. MEBiC1930]|uniref:GDSL-type esterase/lipase family protein n=1 Tax=Seonamhaeicola sp. MEBiC01930 TaxID=2976768 RepID=UPI0032530BF9
MPLQKGDIVFLGNSITEQGGDWGVRLNNSKVKNRGISGDTTDGVLARLGELIYYKPSQVYILIGINDLFREDMTSQKIYENILRIVNEIHKGSPSTEIFVQTILPTTTEKLIKKIQQTNTFLTEAECNNAYTIIPLHSLFAVNNDEMNMEYSTDGVHLNESGYSFWVNNIRTYFAN